MSGARALLRLGGLATLGALKLIGCGFDSSGQGGSGSLQGSSDTSGAPTTLATSASETTTSGVVTTDAPTSTTADPETSSVTLESSTGASGSTESGAGETGDEPPEFGPFLAPVVVGGLDSDQSDDDPTLRADLLEIYFASLRPGGAGDEDIWRATRASPEDPFDPPLPVTALNGPAQEGWPDLTHDGLVLTFGSDRNAAQGAYDIYYSVRANVGAEFESWARADDLSTGQAETASVFPSDRLEVFLCSPAGATADLHRATRLAIGDLFGASAPLFSLNTAARECTPFLDPTGARVLFGSDRVGSVDIDIWTAVRAGDGDDFAMPQNVEDVNSDWEDDDPWLAPDGSALYFASFRNGTDLDIYVALKQ